MNATALPALKKSRVSMPWHRNSPMHFRHWNLVVNVKRREIWSTVFLQWTCPEDPPRCFELTPWQRWNRRPRRWQLVGDKICFQFHLGWIKLNKSAQGLQNIKTLECTKYALMMKFVHVKNVKQNAQSLLQWRGKVQHKGSSLPGAAQSETEKQEDRNLPEESYGVTKHLSFDDLFV